MKHMKMLFALLIAIALCFGFAWYHENKNIKAAYGVTTTTTSSTVEVTKSSYTPTEATTIVLDAGHGGYDSGSGSEDGILEKDITLSLTLKIGELLQDAGYNVVYTRVSDTVSWESDNLSDLKARIAIASQAEADYFISIHTNFSEYNDGAYGFETYLDYSNSTITSMAEAIHAQLDSLSYSIDRGLKSTSESSLYVIDHNQTPAMLLEVGFLSDPDDAYELINQQDELAQAIAQGIIDTI